MKFYRILIFLSTLLFFGSLGVNNILAMDENGCLTCHQYPGLARPEKHNGFKIFHIDEAEYLKSSHGKLTCNSCHTTVHKVPHVGETKVNCNHGCHLEEKDKKRIETFNLKTLHAKEQSYLTRLSDGSSCQQCHLLYPHQTNELARAFINLHIGFMTCETCHINLDKFKPIVYDWTSSETADFQGKPFGSRFNPNVSGEVKSTHFISRISVYSVVDGKKKSLVNTWDTQKAKDYLAEENTWSDEEKKERLKYFHQDIHKTAVSVTCNECHAKSGILNFQQLGFSDKKATDLINLNIKGLVTKYKIFYFPDMFRQ